MVLRVHLVESPVLLNLFMWLSDVCIIKVAHGFFDLGASKDRRNVDGGGHGDRRSPSREQTVEVCVGLSCPLAWARAPDVMELCQVLHMAGTAH